MADVIMWFRGNHRFLSNFYPAEVYLYQECYPTVEHAFQAAKTLDRTWRKKIRCASSPGNAKRLGWLCPLRVDWEEVRIPIMRDLLEQKFAKYTMLRRALDQTAPAILIEGNNWGDCFWGQSPVGKGENWLGRLLMDIRDAD